MARYGSQFGPDFTFLGVPECDLDDESSYADADVVILGAPFDGGTTYRAGARFGPQAIRMTDYLPHDGSRPSLALRTDGLADLKVYDAGDVEMYSGDIEVALPALEAAVQKVVQAGAIPISLGGDHSIAYPDAKGCANVIGAGRVSMIHFDAHADTGDIEFGSLWGHGQPMRRLIESGAIRGDRFLQIGLRGYWPPPETLDWMAWQNMRSYEMTEIVQRGPLRDAVRRICLELPVIGMDVVEVSPPYDHADITAALANRVVLEALCAIARKRKDARDGTQWDPLLPLLSERAAPIPEGTIQSHHHTHLGHDQER